MADKPSSSFNPQPSSSSGSDRPLSHNPLLSSSSGSGRPSSSHNPPPSSSLGSDKPKMKFMPNSLKNKQKKIIQPKLEPSSESSFDASTQVLDNKLRNLALLVEERRQGIWGPSKVEKKIDPMDDAFTSIDPRAVASSAYPKNEGAQDDEPNNSTEYEDPYDYSLNYPVDFPYRRPHTRCPYELGEKKSHEEEKKLTTAEELELLDDKDDEEMYFFKFPTYLPMEKPSATSARGKEKMESGRGLMNDDKEKKECCTLADLPAGSIGKLLVYKSGAVKMKMGDVIFKVETGIERNFPQNAMAMNTETKQSCLLGEVNKQVYVTLDVLRYCNK